MKSSLFTVPAGTLKLVLIAAGTLLALSCSLALRRIDLLSDATTDGSYLEDVEKIRKNKDLYGNTNRLLYFIDQGLLYHYAGRYDSSLAAFELAETVIDELYARSITTEAASLLTNDLLRPYRSRRYERILLHQFIAFDYLAKNEFDEALVESRKVQLLFDSYSSRDRLKQKYQDDGMSHYISSIVYEAQGETDNSIISLFKSVSAYQHGPLKLPNAVENLAYYRFESNDRHEDIHLLNIEPSLPPERVAGLEGEDAEIVFIGYAGKSPLIAETVFSGTYILGGLIVGAYRNAKGEVTRVVIPAPPLPESEIEKLENKEKTKAGTTFHIKFALPEPVRRPSKTRGFKVFLDSENRGRQSVVLTDTEILLENDIENNAAVTLARTALRVVLRTLAAQRTKRELQTASPLANLLLNVGTDILADQLEKADTRLCFLFPRTVQIARIPASAGTHRVEAIALDNKGLVIGRNAWEDITLGPGEKKFVFFPSLL